MARAVPADPEFAVKVWSTFVDHVTATVTDAFAEHGIEAVLLKGAAFARLLYDRTYERAYTDSDLLVPSECVPAAESLLEELGFVRVDRDEDWLEPVPKYAHTFQRPSDGAAVDLHWTLSGVRMEPQRVWSVLREHATQLKIAGRPVTTLDAAASGLMVALHSAHHGTSRSVSVTDLDRAVERVTLAQWTAAKALAERLDAHEAFVAGLRVSAVGDALADRLELPHVASVDMWLKSNPRSYGAWVLDRVACAPTVRGRTQTALRIVVPTRRAMTVSSALARRGRVGLALAYVIRPFRLLVRTIPALLEWLRVRDAVRAQARP